MEKKIERTSEMAKLKPTMQGGPGGALGRQPIPARCLQSAPECAEE